MNEFYTKETIEESYKELINFVGWINKQYGYYPVIIGGWAVFSYVKSMGSRDIDIIFPTRESTDRVLLPYYMAAGYKSSGMFAKQFYKEIKTGKKTERIYLDACSLADRNLLHENSEIEIPWSLGMKHSKEWKIGNVVARVPNIELLLIYKVKALLDRRYDLRKTVLSAFQRSYINSKIWKDEQDVLVLKKCDMNEKFIEDLLKETGFKKYFERENKRIK